MIQLRMDLTKRLENKSVQKYGRFIVLTVIERVYLEPAHHNVSWSTLIFVDMRYYYLVKSKS